ncbi:MAG: SDR family NAD(P)-dependent oxidoreductase [Thermodesulfobacteriota bacterium]|nr:SDR family NAD(P)-dependent oxidoreductase [Thermodesulfobacteriota bacterium]
MALKLDAVGKKLGPVTREYTWKDAVLYALGVGAGFDNLEYCYEKELKVLPSFSIAAIFDFLTQIALETELNLAGLLHAEQELIFHKPIPPSGTLTTEGQIPRIYDKGDKGALIIGESDTYHSNGEKLFTSIITLFARFDGGFGGENAPKKEVTIPDRAPDIEAEDQPSPDQPLLYRLSGDVNPLHVDKDFAKMAGFDQPIMHGLCTHGFACRMLIENLIPGEPEKARRMACRFSKTLVPGDPIKLQIWKEGDSKALWRVINAKTGDTVIDLGEFEYGEIPRDEIRFDDRVAIVTGAGGGLGREYALKLAQRGAKVVVNDLGGSRDGTGGSASPADKVVDEIKAEGGQAVANYDNVATPEGGEAIVQAALDAFGTVDILINNAGILRDKSFVKMEPDNWDAVIAVHLQGAYHVTRPAFRIMKEKGYGRIIMTTSAAGLYGNFGQTNYSSAKMALVGMMNTLKIEGAKYDIKVNTVAPLAASRLTEDIMPPEIFEKMDPAFVSAMTLYLCSERCPVNGNIYNAGMGFFNRAAVVTGPGTVLGKDGELPSVEEIRDNLPSIDTLKNGKEYWQVNDQVGDLITILSGPPAGSDASADTASGGGGTANVADFFASMPDHFDKDAAKGVDVVFNFIISGDNGGDWHCIVKDQTCTVNQGAADQATCTIKMSDGDFLDMMGGKLPPMKAYTSGKLVIEGDVMKSQLIEKLFKQ